MTPEAIALRNRANSKKSTGPKTAEGKAVVAGNARRHGATARPDPEAVATWLGIILDDPEITPACLIPTDERGVRALLLAQAEVQLVAVHRAMRDFEAETPLILRLGKNFTWRDIWEGLRSGEIQPVERNLTYRQIYRRIQEGKKKYQAVARRQKLLKRYLGEARAQRRKAFLAWLVASGGADTAA